MITPELPEPISFDWDRGNQNKNFAKHGITDTEAEEPFLSYKLIIPDQRHGKTESRFGMYGRTNAGKILFITFTIRNGQIRIISARPADKKERSNYEEASKKTT